MKISLISPFSGINATGLRTLSACLKREGHDVKLIFMQKRFTQPYEETVLDKLVELIKDTELVGISVMTNYYDNVIQLTEKIKKNINVPVIWGGIHPTIRPEESLQHADMACRGEAEETLVELVKKMENGQNYLDTIGIWFKHEGKIIENNLRPLVQNLDKLPFQDYDWKTHYISSKNDIHPMTEDLMNYFLMGDYMAQPTRGCPFGCTYCCNNTFKKMYPEQKPHFRKRSIPNVIEELLYVKNNLPFIKQINFNDDAFFFYSDQDIKEFSDEYKKKIGLPLLIAGATPSTLTRNKLTMLLDAGLMDIRMGIETECERTKKLYNRNYSHEQVKKAVELIGEFKNQIPMPRYDIIFNNPWETDEDLIETLMFIGKIPVPHHLNLFSMNFYPGTELYDKAKAEGIIKDDLNDCYRNSFNVVADGLTGRLLKETYLNNLFYLLYVYHKNGIAISESTMKLLTNFKKTPFRSKFRYTLMRYRAGWLLKKNLFKKAIAATKETDQAKIKRWNHEGYILD